MLSKQIGETLDKEGIPYVRFDGQMSAKRRQETIARFSVPIKEEVHVATQPSTTQDRPKRQTRRSRTNIPSDAEVVVLDDDDDGDFVAGDEEEDDDFIDSDDDRPTTKKGKGKSKGKNRASPEPDYDEVVYEGVNPKVMLISLKAGALGLNLTVANNVYL